ncbi:unnamed protein product [Fusarium graminearum]|uniref:Uncharacterized protein n=1 Tax=Gibberella zeae TaxID=5518 RepID=A0A4E9E5Q4_GIBZA|nr:unnamed protein product [Fusarium graminearum]
MSPIATSKLLLLGTSVNYKIQPLRSLHSRDAGLFNCRVSLGEITEDSESKTERKFAMEALMSGDGALALLFGPARAKGRAMRVSKMVDFIVNAVG